MMYTLCMVRTQILLRERQHEALRALARREGKSLSEMVRLALARLLGEENPAPGASRLCDIRALAKDPGGPSAREHDSVLYDRKAR